MTIIPAPDKHNKKLQEYYAKKSCAKSLEVILSELQCKVNKKNKPNNDKITDKYKQKGRSNNKYDSSGKLIPAKNLLKVLQQSQIVDNLNPKLSANLPKDMQMHAQVACYINGILTVHLDNSVWANQFRYLKLDLLGSLRKYPEFAGLIEIKHKICHIHSPIKPKVEKCPLEFSKDNIKYLKSMINEAENLKNIKLKNSLEKLLKSVIK